jgi:superfamily II DNA or RNA helicase
MPAKTTSAILDHRLTADISTLPEGALMNLCDALTIPNMARIEAKKQHQWGWESMPENLQLWAINGDELSMPRGFASTFAEGIRMYGYKISWLDRRRFEKTLDYVFSGAEPRPWQKEPIHRIVARHQGIYKAPAGSGKTAVILFALQQLQCKSLIIVNTKDIVWQWQERIEQFMGPDYPVGQIGDNIFDVSEGITVATAQTLNSRFLDLEQKKFFEEFSFVCLDEMHHVTASTFNRIMDRFSARYRIGVSATPDKTGEFKLATNVLGPIICETKPQEVSSLERPRVIRVPTKFGYGFRPTKSRWQRSNYPQMIQALVTDPERNAMIANTIKYEEGNHCLVLSKRLEHLEILEALTYEREYDGHILRLTGQDDNDHRKLVKEIISEEPGVLFSTLAEEAFDVPRLDRLFLTFPQRSLGLITQQVGRVERKHPNKKDAIIYDFVDGNVGVLESQWRERRRHVYLERGYEVSVGDRAR